MYYYSSYFPKLWYCDHRSETDLTRETRNEKKKNICMYRKARTGWPVHSGGDTPATRHYTAE